MSELDVFFLVIGILAVAMGASIGLHPIGWARVFTWPLPDAGAITASERNLTLYFGRCLGGFAAAFGVVALRAAVLRQPGRDLLIMTVLVGAALTIIHVYGAIRRVQPVVEHFEIIGYGGLTLWAMSLYVRLF